MINIFKKALKCITVFMLILVVSLDVVLNHTSIIFNDLHLIAIFFGSLVLALLWTYYFK